MKPKAIVYTSNTGYTKQYAQLLHQNTHLPLYDLSTASTSLPKGEPILYLGWLMASQIKGYKQAHQKYHICAVCGVGLGPTGSQLEEVRKSNHLPEDLPLFTLQGGFDMEKLTGIYKLLMTIMKKTAGKGLQDKKNKTDDEEKMLQLLFHGGNYVTEENLDDVMKWFHEQRNDVDMSKM